MLFKEDAVALGDLWFENEPSFVVDILACFARQWSRKISKAKERIEWQRSAIT
jgi:hypothetical protein